MFHQWDSYAIHAVESDINKTKAKAETLTDDARHTKVCHRVFLGGGKGGKDVFEWSMKDQEMS